MYRSLAPYYAEIFPLKAAVLSFVRSFIKKPSCRVLDVGCAVGQLAMALAREGHQVTGIDLDAVLIEKASKDAADQNIKVDFAGINMMDVAAHFPSHSFFMVLCLGNTLVHLPSLEEISEFIKKVSNLLTGEGVFIVQVVNYDHILNKGITALPVIDTEHVRFERHYTYEQSKHLIHFQTGFTIKDTQAHFEDKVMLYPLRQSELASLIKSAGFNKVNYFGDFSANRYSLESPALIAVSRLNP